MLIHPDTIPIDAERSTAVAGGGRRRTGKRDPRSRSPALEHWQPIGAVIARIVQNIRIVPDD